MLSDYEKNLYELAKAGGYVSDNEHDVVAIRREIEWFLIDTVWKSTPRFKDVPPSLAAVLPKDAHPGPDDSALDWFKLALDLNLYTFDDYRIEELVHYLQTDNVDAFKKVLDAYPELMNRRNSHDMRPLLHEAIAQRKVWAVQWLVDKGACLKMLSGGIGFNAVERACDNRSMDEIMPVFFQHARQYDVVRGMMAYNNAESACLEALQKTALFAQPNTPAEKVSLLPLAIEKRCYKVIKHLILDHTSPNIPDAKGIMPLHHHAIVEIDKLMFHDRAQSTTPGLVSFLLAAGANPREASANGLSLFGNIERVAREFWPTFAISGVEIAAQCWLVQGDFPVIILTKSDYDLLKQANLLTVKNAIYIVCEEKNVFTVHYQRYGFERMLSFSQLDNDLRVMLHWLIALIYPKFIDLENPIFPPFNRDHNNQFSYISRMFDNTRENVIKFTTGLLKVTVEKPLHLDECMNDEDSAIHCVSHQYQGRAIPLYDECIPGIIALATAKHFLRLLDYIYSNIQLDNYLKNIKPLLYQSLDFMPMRFTREIINQPFSDKTPFYLKIQAVYDVLNVERATHPHAALVKKNRLSPNAPMINEFYILKEIKKVYLRRVREGINDPQWKEANIAIRDSLVLAKSTLFLNVFRTNSKLTEIKDTDSYIELCNLIRNIPISPEAKAELAERVLPKAEGAKPTPSLRDVVMFLVLVCKDKATFTQVCHDYLLVKNLSDADKKALNDALCLLSNEDHNRLRDYLVKVSIDPLLHAALKERLPKKNCAFIDIVRTSENDRKIMNTQTYKDLVVGLEKEKDQENKKEKHFHMPSVVSFFRPKHSANFDAVLSQDEKFYPL